MECSALTGQETCDKSLAAANSAVEDRNAFSSKDAMYLQLVDDPNTSNRTDATYLPLTKNCISDAAYRQLTDNRNASNNSDITYLEPIQHCNAFNSSDATYLEPIEYNTVFNNSNVTYQELGQVEDRNNVNAVYLTTADAAAVNGETYSEIPDTNNDQYYSEFADANREDYAELPDTFDNDAPASSYAQSVPRSPNIDAATSEQIQLPIANNNTDSRCRLSHRLKVAAVVCVVGLVCVGAVVTNAVAITLKFGFTHAEQLDAAGAALDTQITTTVPGRVFAVDESSADYYSTFVKRFKINFTGSAVTTFTIAQGLETFEIKFYEDGTNTGQYKGSLCVTVKLVACRYQSIELVKHITLAMDNDIFYTTPFEGLINEASKLVLHEVAVYNLISRDDISTPLFKMLNGGILTMTMSGSYIVSSQHDIRPPQAKFQRAVHTSVDMSYTWSLRNVTLPMIAATSLSFSSATLFGGLGVAEFKLLLFTIKTRDEDAVSIYSTLKTKPELVWFPIQDNYTKTEPELVWFPIQVNYTYDLIDNACGLVKSAIIDSKHGSTFYSYKNDFNINFAVFNYSNFKLLVEKYQCVTIKYRVVYDVVSNE